MIKFEWWRYLLQLVQYDSKDEYVGEHRSQAQSNNICFIDKVFAAFTWHQNTCEMRLSSSSGGRPNGATGGTAGSSARVEMNTL